MDAPQHRLQSLSDPIVATHTGSDLKELIFAGGNSGFKKIAIDGINRGRHFGQPHLFLSTADKSYLTDHEVAVKRRSERSLLPAETSVDNRFTSR